MSALARCEFPAKTGTEPECWNWMHCEIHGARAAADCEPLSFLEELVRVATRKRRTTATNEEARMELVMPDMAGEAIIEEIEHPQTFFVIRSLLRKSAAALLLIDAWELVRAAWPGFRRDEDPELPQGNRTRGRRQPHVAAAGRTGLYQGGPGRRLPRRSGGVRAPDALGTWQRCQQDFRDYAFFAASAVGCCTWLDVRGEGLRRVPLRAEPHGIIEPFQWLLERLHPQGRR